MANRQDNDDSGPNPLLIFAILSAILVLIVMIVFVVVIISATSSTNKLSATNGPYNVAVRPIPNVSNTTALLPKQLDKFQRGALTGTIDNFKATYKNGDYQIDISGSQAISVILAQSYVNSALQKDGAAAMVQRQQNSDPSYYLTTGTGAVHFVWSHYRWFFDVKANSQAALDEFMKVFKY
jgi:hypothetical protein